MSLISYSGECITDTSQLCPLIFLVPLLLRMVLGLKAPIRAIHKRCYIHLSLISASLLIFQSWPCYFTYLGFIFTIDICLLSICTANSITLPNYLELFNALTFFTVFYTPTWFWVSIAMVWAMNIYKSLGTCRIGEIASVLVQIICGVLVVVAADQCLVHEFYILLSINLGIMLIHVELKST